MAVTKFLAPREKLIMSTQDFALVIAALTL